MQRASSSLCAGVPVSYASSWSCTCKSKQRRPISTSSRRSSHYQTLGLSPTASRAEIKETFYKLSRRIHPDSGSSEASADRFAKISEAYSVLGDATARRKYDDTRSASSASAPGYSPSRSASYGGGPSYYGGGPTASTSRQYPTAGPFSGWRQDGPVNGRQRPTHGYAWSPFQRPDAAQAAYARRDPFAMPDDGSNPAATWGVFQRMSAQDARRAQRQSQNAFDNSFVDGSLPYGGGTAGKAKGEDSTSSRFLWITGILTVSYLIAHEVRKSIQGPPDASLSRSM